MIRSLSALTVVLACGAGPTFAAEVHPEDFAYGMPIKTPLAGTAYRLTLPVEVFTKVANEDLRDIRVFNARGEAVPYEIQPAAAKQTTRPQGPSLPLYPLHGAARAALDGLRVTIHSAGTAVDMQAAGAAPDPHGHHQLCDRCTRDCWALVGPSASLDRGRPRVLRQRAHRIER